MKPNNIATNAARIAMEIDRDQVDDLLAADEAVRAAVSLDRVESMKGFSWEDQPTDWESACAALAGVISRGTTVTDWTPFAVRAALGQL